MLDTLILYLGKSASRSPSDEKLNQCFTLPSICRISDNICRCFDNVKNKSEDECSNLRVSEKGRDVAFHNCELLYL